MSKTRYSDYPGHPLRYVHQELLDVVRSEVRALVSMGDVRLEDDMIEPFADCLVQAVVEAGWSFDPPHDCEAVIWHGPGHQSKTRCESWSLQHEIEDGEILHYAQLSYGPAYWTGDKGFD